ncbi:hypothetical protein N9K80_01040 [Flavobacteriaceae bacterium]|nr:hypothetical protein [Flavobacteriaceae bacterium]
MKIKTTHKTKDFPNGAYPLFQRGSRCAVLLFFGLLLTACSTKKDRFLNREWHALNTKYNVVFNGEMAFEQAWDGLQDGYQENFWEPLPIERFAPKNTTPLASTSTQSPFSLAEQKAAKAIAKHGMTIKGEEKNSQMVAAYALLGRARYYDQRFVPALEAFNYIIRRYPASNKLNEVRVWKEKTNLRLGNEAIALENINRLLKYRKLKGQVLADAYATRAQAHLDLQHIDSASWDLKRAQAFSKKPLKKARYGYLLGQLYQTQQKEDSALWAYENVVSLNRRISPIFLVQSKLQILFLKAKAGNTDKEAIGALSKMEDNWEYKNFLDRIYFEKSQLLRARNQDSLAIVYANKSLRATNQDPKRNAENYRLLAQIYFDQDRFETAGFYFDSLSQNLVESSMDYFRTRKKLSGIEDLVYYEKQIATSDSLLRLAAMSPKDQEAFVQEIINTAKRKDSLLQLDYLSQQNNGLESGVTRPSKANKNTTNSVSNSNTTNSASNSIGRPSNFYFYNATSLARGKQVFEQQWGDRGLADNWRWIISPKTIENQTASQAPYKGGTNAPDKLLPAQTATASAFKTTEEWAALKTAYLDSIPKEAQAIEALNALWEEGHYQSGKLYQDFFKRPDLAADRWGTLVDKPATLKTLVPTLYALYMLYSEAGNINAAVLRDRIIRNHPDSDYAKVLLNPTLGAQKEAEFNSRYKALLASFDTQDFSAVLQESTQWLSELLEDPKGAPIALIQANAIGRLYGLLAYKSALKELPIKYPKTPVAIEAQKSLDQFEANPPNARFDQLPSADRHYVALLHETPHDSLVWNNYHKEFETLFPSLSLSREVFSPGKTFYVITKIKDMAAAKSLVKHPYFKTKALKNQEIFVVLGSHYKILQLYKNMADYRKYLMESLDTDQ